jgi:hypothetical protein
MVRANRLQFRSATLPEAGKSRQMPPSVNAPLLSWS